MHESGNAAQHVGHHQHQHVVADDDMGNQPKSTEFQTAFHADCVSCTAVLTLAILLESTTISDTSVTHDDHHRPSKIPTPYLALPERPQWLA